jgi:hypothetical protein
MTVHDDRFFLPFPWWDYLKQPLFDPNHPLLLNPMRFWLRYQLEFLERCLTWQERSIALLEHCWQLKSNPQLHSKTNVE